MPTKKKNLPIEPALITIRHKDTTVEVMSQLDEKGRLFVACPHCDHNVRLSRYGNPGNFQEHYLSKRCIAMRKSKLGKKYKAILVEKFGPMYGGSYD